eukprot:scaffold629017_cov59-Attheya_sp.AAC.2
MYQQPSKHGQGPGITVATLMHSPHGNNRDAPFFYAPFLGPWLCRAFGRGHGCVELLEKSMSIDMPLLGYYYDGSVTYSLKW